MATQTYGAVDPHLYPAGSTTESSASAVSWSAIVAGTVAAIGLSLILLTLGSALGLASVSPWPGVGARPITFTIGAGLWLIVTQWLSAGVGGYMAGRLRVRWHGLHTDEVFFRDTAHGLLAWATATVLMAIVAVAAGALSAAAPVPVPTPVDATAAKEALDAARKAAAQLATFTGLSLLIGAFIGSVAGAIGGRLRDMHP